MSGINNLAKNVYLAQLNIVQNLHYFCKVRACRILAKNSIFQKLPNFFVETFLLMSVLNNLAKKYFLSTIYDSTKFSLFL